MIETRTFDVDRATDILNKGHELGMYPDPLPESDQDKVVEAEKLVAMAEQAKQVADMAGKEKVAHYDAVMQILFVAEVVGGSVTEGMTAAPESAPSSNGAAASVPAVVGDVWSDENGTEWLVRNAPAEGQVEVSLPGQEEVTTIPVVNLKTKVREGEPLSAPPTAAEPPLEPAQQEQAPKPPPASTNVPLEDDEGDPEYAGLLERAELLFERDRMPLPHQVVDPPQMPDDLTAIGDLQQRKLHSQFNALAARSHFLLGLERQKKIDCKRLMKQALKPAMRNARNSLGKDASVTEVTQQAEEHPTVTKWATRFEHHSDQEDAYRTMYEIYTENVSVLSRDWTMRGTDEAGS